MAKNMKIGDILKKAGIIDDFQLNSALSYQRHWGGHFGEALIKLGYLTENKLQDFLARQYDVPQVELSGRQIPEGVLACIPVGKVREFHVVPIERRESNGTTQLVVAMTDPTNLTVIDTLQFLTSCRIKPALATAEAIGAAIDRNYGMFIEEQEEFDIDLDSFCEPSIPTREVASETAPVASLRAHKRLEERYENLIRILLDRGILLPRDLEELM